MTAQAFETGDYFNIFLKFWGFWGSFSVKDFSYKKKRVAKSISMLKVKLFSCFTCDTFSKKQSRSSHQRCSIGVLKNFTKFTGKLLCQSLFFNKVQASGLQLYWKETLSKVFPCQFCDIFKNTFFTEYIQMIASGNPFNPSHQEKFLQHDQNLRNI